MNNNLIVVHYSLICITVFATIKIYVNILWLLYRVCHENVTEVKEITKCSCKKLAKVELPDAIFTKAKLAKCFVGQAQGFQKGDFSVIA